MASARSTERLLLLLTVCLFLTVALAWALGRKSEPRDPADQAAASPTPVAGERPSPVAPSAATQSAPPLAEPSAIPHTRLPLQLLATVVGEDPARSLATIVDTERAAHHVMSEGQLFEGHPNARLASIERGRVLIDNDGVREQLVLAQAEAAPIESEEFVLAPEERERRRDLARRLRELTDAGSEALGPGERGGLLAEGDVSAAYENGEMIGVQIDGIRAGGLYDRIGLRTGDVVTAINGVSLADPSALAKLAAQAATSEVLELTVDPPDGPPTTVQLPTGELESLVSPE